MATAVTDAASFQDASGATAQQMSDMRAFLDLLTDWNQRMNLVGPSALAEFWSRHAWDSAQLLALKPDALTWADLGAGAGFPGIVLAILLKGRAGAHVHLVESMAKRCRFLSEVTSRLELPATVHNRRAEDMRIKVDAVTARACAPMSRLIGFAQPLLKQGAKGVFLKGQDVASELHEATKSWNFSAELIPSLSQGGGHIVELDGPVRAR